MLDKLTQQDFAKHLNSTFTVSIGGKKTQKWKLIEASTVRSDGIGSAKRHPFSVVFAGPGKSAVEQGVYKMKHPKMRNMEILVCPVAPEGGQKMHYEAIFS